VGAPVRIAIAGAGRMGRAILGLAGGSDDVGIVAVWVRNPDEADLDVPGDVMVTGDLDAAVAGADVLVDFTLPEATSSVVAAALGRQKALVSGVSGLSDHQFARIQSAATAIPVVYDRNMSEGIAILHAVVRDAAARLDETFSVAIEEIHHAGKKDAPSGTALKLRGEVPGEHTVIFESPSERLAFRHGVTTRDVFAAGALRAARWVPGRPPGLYSMHDVLFRD